MKLGRGFSNVDVFFSVLSNKLIFTHNHFFRKMVLPSSMILSVRKFNAGHINLRLSVYQSTLTGSFEQKMLYKAFTFMNDFSANFQSGFFTEIHMIGLGFRLERVTPSVFYLTLGYASGIYFFVPVDLRVCISTNYRKIFLFGHSISRVMSVMSTLLLLRKSNPYRVLGLVRPGKIVRLRAGKQR